MTTHAEVQAQYDALMVTNAADPYIHADYELAEAVLMGLAVGYYGSEYLADQAREVMYDCGEVWTRAYLVKYLVERLSYDMQDRIDQLGWAYEDDYVTRLVAEITGLVSTIRDIDPAFDVEAAAREAAWKALQDKAEQGSGNKLPF